MFLTINFFGDCFLIGILLFKINEQESSLKCIQLIKRLWINLKSEQCTSYFFILQLTISYFKSVFGSPWHLVVWYQVFLEDIYL